MVKGHEYQRRNNNQANSYNQGQRNQQEYGANRENSQVRSMHRENREGRENRDNRENRDSREGRENTPRQGLSNLNSQPRYNRVKTEETIDDIRADIQRIEKEIQLEIKEIKSMRLGL